MSDDKTKILNDKSYKSLLWNNIFSDKDFLKKVYRAIFDKSFIVPLSVEDIVKYSSSLAEILMSNPDEEFLFASAVFDSKDFLSLYNVSSKKKLFLKLDFGSFPKSFYGIKISHSRVELLGKPVYVEGILKQKSKVLPLVDKVAFECSSCGTYEEKFFKIYDDIPKSKVCRVCGRRMNVVKYFRNNYQVAVLEEDFENVSGRNELRRLQVVFPPALCDFKTDELTGLGVKVGIFGVLNSKDVKKPGSRVSGDFVLDAVSVNIDDEEMDDIIITDEDVKKIKDISVRDDLIDLMVKSVAPSIIGMDDIKLGILLSLFGGVSRVKKDKAKIRGNIHILVIGEPGTAKSQLLMRIKHFFPKTVYVSGKGASGVGLTASIVRNELTGQYSLEAGAIVLANKGVLLIDEIDKTSPDDLSNLYGALEQGKVVINKANIHAELPSDTTVIATGNPKFGRFDKYSSLVSQINLPPPLINRFDLIFLLSDEPSKNKDMLMAEHIVKLHNEDEVLNDVFEGVLDDDLLKKYIVFSRRNVFPRVSDDVMFKIKDYYSSVRNNIFDSDVKGIPINLRSVNGIVRLSEAVARMRLKSIVDLDDFNVAISLYERMIKGIATDNKGNIDIDLLETGSSSLERNRLSNFKNNVLFVLKEEFGNVIPFKDIVFEASKKGFSEDDVNVFLDKLKKSGDIYEFKKGFIKFLE